MWELQDKSYFIGKNNVETLEFLIKNVRVFDNPNMRLFVADSDHNMIIDGEPCSFEATCNNRHIKVSYQYSRDLAGYPDGEYLAEINCYASNFSTSTETFKIKLI